MNATKIVMAKTVMAKIVIQPALRLVGRSAPRMAKTVIMERMTIITVVAAITAAPAI
jgi:hypothetical protein